ncbi:MAG: co-chaperone GroES [Coriobacteriia bacterium]|nr:MAG: co-chaperone GroES [Coriobacteriia bacterium]HJJ00056.1 co-chaperone GroES [Coriobacteriaceae bacterium]
MNLKPLGDRVIIKQDEAEETTASGLILTSNSKEKPQRGKVIAVGEGKYHHGSLVPVPVKPGDTVIYGKYGGQDITVDGEEYVILRAEDLYAVVD